MINIRDKGAKAELEFCSRFQPFFPNKLERNLLQTREGGSDVTGCHPFVIEIKRVEDLCDSNKARWWAQVTRAAEGTGGIPCVAYRPNRSPWQFILPATLIGLDEGFVEVSETVWLRFVVKQLEGV